MIAMATTAKKGKPNGRTIGGGAERTVCTTLEGCRTCDREGVDSERRRRATVLVAAATRSSGGSSRRHRNAEIATYVGNAAERPVLRSDALITVHAVASRSR